MVAMVERAGVVLLGTLAALAALVIVVWGAGALWYQVPQAQAALVAIAWCGGMLGLAAYAALRRSIVGACFFMACLGLLLIWWSTITPSNDRQWAREMAQALTVAREGDIVTLTNVRDFEWTSLTEAHVHWDTRRYDLRRLESLDIVSLYWMGPAIAHTYFSFVFEGGETVMVSIEIRKERDEAYSSIAGFFKSYELMVLAGDERDLIGWRVFAPGETAYLYRTALPQRDVRALFEAVLRLAERLHQEPEFYDTWGANCTTAVFDLAEDAGLDLPIDWRIVLSGYLPEYLYARGLLDTREPLEVLRLKGDLFPRAKAAMAAGLEGPAFSMALRQGVPRP